MAALPRAARPLDARRRQLITERQRLAQEYAERDGQYAAAIGELDQLIRQAHAQRPLVRLAAWIATHLRATS